LQQVVVVVVLALVALVALVVSSLQQGNPSVVPT
jgi:hypothetical protein